MSCVRPFSPLFPSFARKINCKYASNAANLNVFNRKAKGAQRDRAALHPSGEMFDYLRTEVADRLLDRLLDVAGRTFPVAIDLGSHAGQVLKTLNKRGGIETLFMCDISENMLRRSPQYEQIDPSIKVHRICCDEEFLPFAPKSVDLVLSNMSMHWINDLPGAMVQVRKALKPDGLFLGSMLGGDTLHELRVAFSLAEQEISGGVAPHISPMAFVSDGGNLLSRAGFNFLTVDHDVIQYKYPDMRTLMEHLRWMGEANAVANRRPFTPKKVFDAAERIYKEKFSTEDGCIYASFEVIYMTGWSPDPSQRKPLKRGQKTDITVEDLAKELGGRVITLTEDGPDSPPPPPPLSTPKKE